MLSPNPAIRRADPPSALNNSFGATNGGIAEKKASPEPAQAKSRRTGYTYEQLSVLISQKQDNSFEDEAKKPRPANKSTTE